VTEAHRNFGGGTEPLVNFGVTIGKRDAASARMIRGWNVAPVDMHILGTIQEVSVIDRIRMLINRDENLGRPVNGGKLEPLTVAGKERVYALGPGVSWDVAKRTKKRVHAEAPGPTGITLCALGPARIDVRW